ncbi:acetyl-CoA acetyltransferase [Amycolatopsis anabasis]|uniref:acetyl-CoA acetyltransferase n=1 Tax=Amycolatopsis anabasis TaxID=1840409 RepID=UPI00131AFE10|nr:acetyl-CoA acetyltransferase [Amycolatopsis anabasis]
MDPRTPVLVGAGQHTVRTGGTTPRELMRQAAEAALADTGSADLAHRIGCVGVVDSFSWGTADPGSILAADLGLTPAETVYTHTSGTSPVDLLADSAARIQRGALDAVLITGAEAVKSMRSGHHAGGPHQPEGTAPTRKLGSDRDATHAAEAQANLLLPLAFYPLFENALRADAGRDLPSHVDRIARIWGRFAEVARTNPHAWVADPPGAAEIAAVGDRNRMAALPYRKLMTANIFVDQGAALVLCSAETAQAAGIPRDNWVFVHASGSAQDHWFVSERPELHRSPAIAALGRAVLGHAGLGIDDLGLLDLYSCFPSAVQVAAAELGVDLADPARPATVTGGLTFAGGPGSNYVTHSLAALTGRLRAEPDQYALATAVGWFLTKHGAVVLSGRPPVTAYAHHDVTAEVAALPKRTVATGATGDATVETYTVVYDRAGEPERGIVLCGLPGGARAVAASEAPDVIAGLTESDPLGAKIQLTGNGTFTFPI